METTTGGEQHPVVLAFAVAALQKEVPAMEAGTAIPHSLVTAKAEQSRNDPNNKNDIEQCAGSGSDSKEDRPASTTATTTKESETTETTRTEEDAEQRLARSRERNREHARRTRLRKKAHLEALQSKVKGLEAERQVLKQSVEECSIASILLGLSSGQQQQQQQQGETQKFLDTTEKNHDNDDTSSKIALLAGNKRKRFVSETVGEKQSQPLKLTIDGQTTLIGGGKSHIYWKTGVYNDGNGVQRQLTSQQLESLRRERNRMHAKMTRDRKKSFIATIEKTIEELENENQRMRDILSKVSSSKYSQMVTPVTSPEIGPSEGPTIIMPADDDCSAFSPIAAEEDTTEALAAPTKRARHGFSLNC